MFNQSNTPNMFLGGAGQPSATGGIQTGTPATSLFGANSTPTGGGIVFHSMIRN
jgi:hypothetical protein